MYESTRVHWKNKCSLDRARAGSDGVSSLEYGYTKFSTYAYISCAKAEEKKLVETFAKLEEAFTEWESTQPTTVSEFLEYAKKNLSKGLDYYDKIYLKPDGKLFSLKKVFESGAVFDLDFLRAEPTEFIKTLIVQLYHF